RLNVRVTPERQSYRVRERAQVRVQVTTADGKPLAAGAEVAVAALDECLLETASKQGWAWLDAVRGPHNLEVWAATAQGQGVGKRHYGRKAVPHGGGGGRDPARELFDRLLLWE